MEKFLHKILMLLVGLSLTVMSNQSLRLSVVDLTRLVAQNNSSNLFAPYVMLVMDIIAFLGIIIILTVSISIFIQIIKNKKIGV
ncbi:MAG: hypothetical protein ACRCTZ_21470 [Sarcina sp.]